jgi:hypothetical protein
MAKPFLRRAVWQQSVVENGAALVRDRIARRLSAVRLHRVDTNPSLASLHERHCGTTSAGHHCAQGQVGFP